MRSILICLFVLVGCDGTPPEPVRKSSQDIVQKEVVDAGHVSGTDDRGSYDPYRARPCDIELIMIPDGDGGFIMMYVPIYCFPAKLEDNYPDPL